MRVISGSLKGRKIVGYDIVGTRPTMDRVKESVFATIYDYLFDSVCLDLFCGSGSLGIEAISNGSKLCYFVDNNKVVTDKVMENVINFKIEDKVKILNFDYKKSLKYFFSNNIKFDVIFADPPYDYHVIEKIIKYVCEYDLLNDNGLLVLEFENELLEERYGNLYLFKKKKYSWRNVYIYKKG